MSRSKDADAQRRELLRRRMEGEDGDDLLTNSQTSSITPYQEQTSATITNSISNELSNRYFPNNQSETLRGVLTQPDNYLKKEYDKLSEDLLNLQNKYQRLKDFAKLMIEDKATADRQVKSMEIAQSMVRHGFLANASTGAFFDTPESLRIQKQIEALEKKLESSESKILSKLYKKELDTLKDKKDRLDIDRGKIMKILKEDIDELQPSLMVDSDNVQLIEKIGAGGFADVWKAWDYVTAQLVAVKFVKLPKNVHPAVFARHLKREIDIMSATEHKNVIKIIRYFYFTDNEVAYIMEYASGGDLNHLISKVKFSEFEAHQILKQIIEGLIALKSNPGDQSEIIIHYDLKPANILFDENNVPKIADFGLSKIAENGQSILQSTPGTGTVGYTAPETFGLSNKVSPSADTWSLGIIYYEMITNDMNLKKECSTKATDEQKTSMIAETVDKVKILSPEGKNFIKMCLNLDQNARPKVRDLAELDYIKNFNEEVKKTRKPSTPKKPKAKK